MKNENKFYYVRESAFQSILSYTFSLAFILVGFLINRFILGGQWYIYVFWMIMFFLYLSAKGESKLKIFNSDKELIEFLKGK
ncbi:MAG TPA: hypothetical protein VF941_11915 [Clostridia bacterium]